MKRCDINVLGFEQESMTTPPDANTSAPAAEAAPKKTEVVSFDGPGAKPSGVGEAPRTEMPVSAVARLLGVATATDLNLLDGKLDLMVSKVNALQTRMEKVLTVVNGMPSGADLERIDVQIGALRNLIKETLTGVAAAASSPAKKSESTAPKAEPTK